MRWLACAVAADEGEERAAIREEVEGGREDEPAAVVEAKRGGMER